MILFNVLEPIGSIYEHNFDVRLGREKKKKKSLVHVICYCLNANHYHMLLEQVSEGGISEFMKRLGGYCQYFNLKHKRVGPLFQGKFKTKPVTSNEYLLHLSAYINLNDRVHGSERFGGPTPKSSLEEYVRADSKGICHKEIILDQFHSKAEYRTFAEGSLEDILERKASMKELRNLLLE